MQGFGNVGLRLQILVNEGAKLIGVAEFDGSIYDENGIGPKDLNSYKMRSRPRE